MKKDKIKEKYIKLLFTQVEKEKVQNNYENTSYNFASFTNYDVYILNGKYYKLRNLDDVKIKKTLLLYLFKHNFYVPKIIKRIIFKKFLLQNESRDIPNFNYNIYLLLSYLKNPSVNETMQKIIDLDVFRTRINKENEKTIYFFNLFLNYACNYFQFKYKQGLNEVLALFFYLKGKCFNMVDVYFCFQNFVERFLKEFYYDDEFFFLQISFFLFKILIKYHDPVLSEVLEKNKMTPEIYAASWFLTLFASKSNLQILNSIYMIFLLEHNPFFYFFFSLALLILHRNVFLCVDSSNLPELLSKINIFNKKFLKKVWSLGKYLENNTPVSFAHKLFFIKNILIYLTNENSIENNHKKNVLLNFFKSIDYMSINSYEIIKNVSSGRNNYIFLDIRSSRNFKKFHLNNSINVEPVNNIGLQHKKKKKDTNRTDDKQIFYILKKYDGHEVAHTGMLLFSFLLLRKYNGKNNIHYDDNIILKKKKGINETKLTEVNIRSMDKSQERGVKRRKREESKNITRKKRKKIGDNRATSIFNNLSLLKVEENQMVDLNTFFFNFYSDKKCIKRSYKSCKVKFKFYEPLSREYAVEKKVKMAKNYFSDDDVLSTPFSLTSYRIRMSFILKREKAMAKVTRVETEEMKKRKTEGLKSAIRKDSTRNVESNEYYNENGGKDNHVDTHIDINDDDEHVDDEHANDARATKSTRKIKRDSYLLEQNLNISSFNLYLLIKEKVLKDENSLKIFFENMFNPNKEIVILYDDDFKNAKHVRSFYYELIYKLKLKNVSIIEGGINSYHNLIKNKQSESPSRLDSRSHLDSRANYKTNVITKTSGGIKNTELPDFYLCYNLVKNKKVLNHLFHPSHLCYLCDNKNFKKMKKRILDEFFFEIYNDYSIFEDYYYFLTNQRDHVNYSAFFELILRKKSFEKLKKSKKEESEALLFPLSNILNYIKRKKSVDKEKDLNENSSVRTGYVNTTTTITSTSTAVGAASTSVSSGIPVCNNNCKGNHNDGVCNNSVHSTNASAMTKRLSESTQSDMNIYSNTRVKKDYFSLNYYIYYYNRKKNEFFTFIANDEEKQTKCEGASFDVSNAAPCNVTHTNTSDVNRSSLRGSVPFINKCSEDGDHRNACAISNRTADAGANVGADADIDITSAICANESIKVEGDEKWLAVNEEQEYIPSKDLLNLRNKLSISSDNTERRSSSSSDVYSLYSYIDIMCYNYLLNKDDASCSSCKRCDDNDDDGDNVEYNDGEDYHNNNNRSVSKIQCKIYNCFIEYIYQPMIPHNIRSNNIISNFVQYVKYYKNMNPSNNSINDPNFYLNCNKLDSSLFFNLSYFPFNNFRKMHLPNKFSFSKSYEKERRDTGTGMGTSTEIDMGINMSKGRDSEGSGGGLEFRDRKNFVRDDSLYYTVREELPLKKELQNDEDDKGTQHVGSTNGEATYAEGKNANTYDEVVNDSILNNTWIKNKPELGLCKLMIYHNFLILYGVPYLYDVNVLVDTTNKATQENKVRRNISKSYGEHKSVANLKKIKEAPFDDTTDVKDFEGNQAKREEADGGKETYRGNGETGGGAPPPDIGIVNFLKEKKEYNNKKDNTYLNYCDDKLHKMVVHKYKDLKKKDILFNIDCYKLNAIDINWNNISNHMFRNITKEHIEDTYNYYKPYFNLSKNNLSKEEQFPYSPSSSNSASSNNTCSCASDEQDFSFSDYHSLYTNKAKIKTNSRNKNNKKKMKLEYRKTKIDVVNIYAIFDLRTIYKITTKKNNNKTLYFYFSTNKSTPLMVLNFEDELEVQSCVCSVKEVYTFFANNIGGLH
ncbi:conserved Plasmodium protein, unknown function [Plasmodium malariae]|uniref:Rab-GAP TBC domain-containing protein n=1 Tax=Plasmodium malariae TaxID=5858 RepID=A0A1D3TF32_PLAMA|nr:conserved Plasmodium protein, unknown function [Plasmodium malariae]SCP03583.1 conserved Plasmodium protein, unknown function [Plasmodium malariae]